MLLETIIESATDEEKPLPGLLRRCILLADELNNDSLKSWANQELNGYKDLERVPPYRVMYAGAMGVFNAGYAFPNVKRPIPAGGMEKEHRWAAEKVLLGEPVSAYENALNSDKGHTLMYPWSADMVVHYQSEFMPGHALLEAWQEVPFSAVAGMLDTIRTRVLNLALDIRREIGNSDADLKKVRPNSREADKVNSIVINHIYGGTVYMGAQQNISTQNISVGNWQDLRNAMLAAGIKEDAVGELGDAIQKDGKTVGAKVKSWIGRNAEKVLDKGVEVGISVGAAVLTEHIKKYLGSNHSHDLSAKNWGQTGRSPISSRRKIGEPSVCSRFPPEAKHFYFNFLEAGGPDLLKPDPQIHPEGAPAFKKRDPGHRLNCSPVGVPRFPATPAIARPPLTDICYK